MEVNKINVAVVGQTKNSFIIPDGYSDEGKIENGLREGEHTIQDENGFRYALLEYRKDKLNGTCSFYDKGRLRKRATYVNDVINGWECHFEKGKEVICYLYENGKKIRELTKCDELKGYWREVEYANPSQSIICQCKNHEKNGYGYIFDGKSIVEKVWYGKGCKKTIKVFNGKKMIEYCDNPNNNDEIYCGEYEDSLTKDYPRNGNGHEKQNGKIIYWGEWKNNKRNGEGCSYENGLVVYEGNWKDGDYDGEGVKYDKNGEMEYEGYWKKGRPISNCDNKCISNQIEPNNRNIQNYDQPPLSNIFGNTTNNYSTDYNSNNSITTKYKQPQGHNKGNPQSETNVGVLQCNLSQSHYIPAPSLKHTNQQAPANRQSNCTVIQEPSNQQSSEPVESSPEPLSLTIYKGSDLMELINNNQEKQKVVEIEIEEKCGSDIEEDLSICDFKQLKKITFKKGSFCNLKSFTLSSNFFITIIIRSSYAI